MSKGEKGKRGGFSRTSSKRKKSKRKNNNAAQDSAKTKTQLKTNGGRKNSKDNSGATTTKDDIESKGKPQDKQSSSESEKPPPELDLPIEKECTHAEEIVDEEEKSHSFMRDQVSEDSAMNKDDEEGVTKKICTMLGMSSLTDKTFKGLVHYEINRPKSQFEIMLQGSKVAAVGRRMFDDAEINEQSDDDQCNPPPPEPVSTKKKSAESRYLNVFEKQIKEKERPQREKQFLQNVRLIKHRPTDFGIWDHVSDPVSVVSSLERQPSIKRSAMTPFEKQVRNAQLEAENEFKDENRSDHNEEKVSSTRVSLKDHPSTGKYLHENDMLWCRRHTRLANKAIINWFKRFRKHSGSRNLSCQGLGQIYRRLYRGNGDNFTQIIFKWYRENPKDGGLDFKDFLIVIEATLCATVREKLKWMSRVIDLDHTKKVHIDNLEAAINMMDCLQDPIPEEYFDNVQDCIDPMKPDKFGEDRSVEERLHLLKCYLSFDIHECISVRTFRNIPVRMISASEF